MNEDAELTGTVRFLKTISNKAEHSSFQVERKRLYAFKRKNTKGMLDYTWGRKKKAWRKNITRPLQVIPPKNAIMQTAYSKFLRHWNLFDNEIRVLGSQYKMTVGAWIQKKIRNHVNTITSLIATRSLPYFFKKLLMLSCLFSCYNYSRKSKKVIVWRTTLQ